MSKSSAKSQKTKSDGSKESSTKTHRTGNQSSIARESNSKISKSKLSEIQSQPICREPACENLVITIGYCRLHYIKNWQRIKRKEAILSDGRLKQYIEELVLKYSDKYIEAIRHDLMTDDAFIKVITELDLHESEDQMVDIDASSNLDDYPMESVRADLESHEDDF